MAACASPPCLTDARCLTDVPASWTPPPHGRMVKADGPGVRNGRKVDLKAIARRELEAAGVAAVHDVGVCTLCADPGLFFSHRRDGGTTGRQAGVAWRS